ncbi:hypothetical protein, partial [Henriciella sp.]|uniref:hypothetical protein n=1 Tax=Henriciella sp. TaxID=1968823 RepID=UPI0025B85B6A
SEEAIYLGRNQEIPVEGWYIWGRVARITWGGAAHFIERRAFWVPVQAAGKPIVKAKANTSAARSSRL